MAEVTGPSRSARRAASARALARVLLGLFLAGAGLAHFLAPDTFLAQVPTWLPARTFLVYASGVVEVVLGIGLLVAPRWRRELGIAAAVFFVVVFPGNVHQAVAGIDAFGLDSPAARWTRLVFQPLFVLWALLVAEVIGAGRGRGDDDRDVPPRRSGPHRP